jgi:hypothetical protein
MYGIISTHRLRHDFEMAGYFASHFPAKRSSALPAASSDGAKDFIVKPAPIVATSLPLMFPDNPRLEFPFPISGYGDFHRPLVGSQRLR